MAINRDAFIGNYLDETIENHQAIEKGLLKLKKDPENEEELNTVLRALHTIKGSSRMLSFPQMEQNAHAMENLFKGIKEKRYPLSNPIVQVIFIGCDLLKRNTDAIRKKREELPLNETFMNVSERIYANEPYDMDNLRKSMLDSAAGTDGTGNTAVNDTPERLASTPLPSSSGSEEYETIRVKLSNIDEIMQTMNQIVIKQFQFKQIQEGLLQFESRFQRETASLRKSKETQPLYREFQEIRKNLNGLRKSFTDQITVIERSTYELQEQLMRLTMLPLELIFGTIPRMVEEVATQLDKSIDCRMSGMDVMLDKAILENLHDPVIHIVRNALDHGFETAEERKKLGKPVPAVLQISCTSEGGNINIRIRDDGKGIDHEKVKRQALDRNLVSREELDSLSESDVYAFLFSAGFSTKNEVTELSGRGVGLDIVRHNIQKVKGKITIQSTLGMGTEFLLSLPLSLATVAGFFVNAGGRKFLIPSNYVNKIIRLAKKDKLTYYNKEAFKLEGSIIPLYSLSSLMGTTSADTRNDHIYVIVAESVGEKIGIIVDAILQHVQLIYKPLPRNMQQLKLVQGTVFDETYSIINILFIPELIKGFKRIRSVDILRGKVADQRKSKRVLVVDDSLNTRDIEKSILELEGFEVVTGVDGIDGLDQAKQSRFDLIITDIEMPRMDGLTMIENIRKDQKNRSIPIIVVSSHTEPEYRKNAMAVGATGYIIKSEFDRNSLSELAHKFTWGDA